MHVLITGAGGLIGQKMSHALLEQGKVVVSGQPARKIALLTLLDLVKPAIPPNTLSKQVVARIACDISNSTALKNAFDPAPDLVFHLAAVVSSAAEKNFDLGMRVNLEGTRQVLEACRRLLKPPICVFPSSVAVFGGQLPDVILDDTPPAPKTSYGTQKMACELLMADYSRKGFVEGRVLRLPTIVIRPGTPNQAASTFASSILRDPLQGDMAICPVPLDTMLWIMSPRRVIESFLHAISLAASAWASSRVINLRGLSISVQEMLNSLEKTGGKEALARVKQQPNPEITRIIQSWPGCFQSSRAKELGFPVDTSMEEIVRTFIEDDLRKK